MFLNEFVIEDVLHVARIKESVVNIIDRGIELGIGYSLLHILYAHYPAAIFCHKIRYGAGSCIKVIDKRLGFILIHVPESKITGYRIQSERLS